MDKLPYISLPNEIPNEEYHNSERYAKFISSSELKQFQVSPKWFRYFSDHPDEARTISLENSMKGSVYHDMLCSITNFGDLSGFENDWVVFDPPINLKTGKPYGFESQAYIGAYQEFVALNPGKQICGQPEIDLAKSMIQELRFGNPHLSADINFLIKHGKAEQSHFVEYQGAYFKFRTDLKTSTKIIDWKTCQKEVPKVENWSKQVVKMGYHISAAFYQFFDHLATGKWRTYYWVAQEKEPPYDFNIIDASNWAYEIINNSDGTQEVIPHSGAIICNQLVENYILCLERNEWPGYSVFTPKDFLGHRIGVAPVPGYAESKDNQFYI